MPCPLPSHESCNSPPPALGVLLAAGKLKEGWKPSPSRVDISCKALPAASRGQELSTGLRDVAEPCSLKKG